MTVSLLADSLRETLLAAHTSPPGTPHLVASFSGNLYHASSGWGRLWRWIYVILDFFFLQDVSRQKLYAAIRKTEAQFIQTLQEVSKVAAAYQAYLSKKALGIEYDEASFHGIRKSLTAWNLATAPFIKQFHTHEKVQRFINSCFPSLAQTLSSKEAEIPLFLGHFIELEGYLHDSLPLDLFAKISIGTSLSKREDRRIRKWVDIHNDKNSPLAVRPFHKGLLIFVETLQKTWRVSNNQPNPLRLERELAAFGLDVFYQKDPVHMKWRSQLTRGSLLAIQDKLLILGEQLASTKKKEDHTIVFTIENEPEKVVAIGINQAILLLKQQVDLEAGFCLISPECQAIDPNGDFAVYERLTEPLYPRLWNSVLSDEEMRILEPVGKMIHWMIEHTVTPRFLDPEHLYFDHKGVLRYAKTMSTEEFNYTALEDFARKLSLDNLSAYASIVHHSGLHQHPYRKFYAKIVQQALDDQKVDFENQPAYDRIEDPRVVDRGKSLYEEIQDLQEAIVKEVLVECEVFDLSEIEQKAKKEILRYYQSHQLLGKLWPSMKSDISQRVCVYPPLKISVQQ